MLVWNATDLIMRGDIVIVIVLFKWENVLICKSDR